MVMPQLRVLLWLAAISSLDRRYIYQDPYGMHLMTYLLACQVVGYLVNFTWMTGQCEDLSIS
jgi:hypothetical protein